MTFSSRSRKAKRPSNLSPSIRRLADLHFLAVGAAGIGLQALAQPAQAEIVYTPANITIRIGSRIPIDLNHDGINDFSLRDSQGLGLGSFTYLIATGLNPGAGIRERNKEALPLPRGTKILPAQIFSHSAWMARAYYGSGGGTWGTSRYLGLKFEINGETHYGWAEVTAGIDNDTITAKLKGYAYETISNRPIIAGQTEDSDSPPIEPATLPGPDAPGRATLPSLALGCAGLSIWRRKKHA